MAPAADIDLQKHDVEVLHVDEEFQMALLRVVSRGGSPSPPPRHLGRTRWSFLKDVPRDLLPGGLKAAAERGQRGLPKVADASTRPSGGGEGGGQDKQRDPHQRQQQQQQQQSRDDAWRRDRVGAESGRRVQQGGDDVTGIGVDAAGRAEPTQPATALSEAGDVAAAAAAAATYPKTPRVKADGDGDDDFYSGTDSDDPSAILSPTTAARMRCPVEVKASRTGRSATANTRGAGRAGAAAAAAAAAEQVGLGVFCKAGLKVGDVVFEEEALLRVSKEAAGRRPWEAVTALGRLSKSWGVSAMDLLQVVAFEGAPPSVQERVLQLFAPDTEDIPQGRLQALEFFLDKLSTAMGVLSAPAGSSSSSCDAPAANGKGAGRLQDAGSRGGGGGGGGGGGIGRDRRSLLLKVLMICDANIFGEGADEENGPRSLFWLGCRINHSCLPNCSYHVLDGGMVVRAIADVEPGEELLVSYLTFEHVARPTPERRLRLLETKFFECHCSRCDAEHDIWRGFRCPRCHQGAVHPSNGNNDCPRPPQEQQQQSQQLQPRQLQPQQQQQQLQQQRFSSSPSCSRPGSSPSSGVGGMCGAPTPPAPLARPGVSACAACGLAPTAAWLESVEVVEKELDRWLHGACESMTAAALLKPLQQAFCVGVYLFADHHLMCSLHREMAAVLLELSDTGVFRGAEASYHLHQLFVGYDSMFGRPCVDAAIECEQLAHTLWQTAIHLQQEARAAARHGRRTPKTPSAGERCRTYAGLVLTPPPRRGIIAEGGSEPTKQAAAVAPFAGCDSSSSGSGPKAPGLGGGCTVCGRRHGDPSRPTAAKNTVGAGGGGGGEVQGEGCGWLASSRRVYLQDCVKAMVRFIETLSVLYGADTEEVVAARKTLVGMRAGFIPRPSINTPGF